MKFTIATVAFQVILIILYVALVEYDPEQSGPSVPGKNKGGTGMSLFPCMMVTTYLDMQPHNAPLVTTTLVVTTTPVMTTTPVVTTLESIHVNLVSRAICAGRKGSDGP